MAAAKISNLADHSPPSNIEFGEDLATYALWLMAQRQSASCTKQSYKRASTFTHIRVLNCVISRKVAGSRPDELNDLYQFI
jgi:hypothetical protein